MDMDDVEFARPCAQPAKQRICPRREIARGREYRIYVFGGETRRIPPPVLRVTLQSYAISAEYVRVDSQRALRHGQPRDDARRAAFARRHRLDDMEHLEHP